MADRCVIVTILGALAMATIPLALAQSVRPGWGSIPYRDANGTGVTFRVWAPNATNVTVPGQFNGWSTTANSLASEGASGVWSADISGVVAGQQYKYFLNGSIWKRDPRSRKVVSSTDNSIVYDPAAFNWNGDNFPPPPLNDLVIYELHAGTFPAGSSPGKLIAATNQLDYLTGLGVTAVEVMPVAEFPGENSWGYNPSDPFAVENLGYGGPDGLKTFIKACHQRGLAVLLDVVHNHYGPTDLDLWNFDGWTGGGNQGGIYFYQDPGLCCTPYGSRPDYSRQPVRDYIQDNFRMWLDEFHVDGFRWDTPGLMINASGYGYVADAASLIQTINTMINTGYPGKISIAEDVMGMGFGSTWDTTFPYVITGQLTPTSDSNRDMTVIANALTTNTRFNVASGLDRVIFTESHDVVGDLNNGVRLPTAIDATTPDSYYARKRSTLGAALVFTAPGVPMLFQGQEMLENLPFDSARLVDWSKTNTYSCIVRLYRDLIRLRRNFDGIATGLTGDQCNVFQVDNVNRLVAYSRWNRAAPTQDVIVIANFANATRTNYSLSFPRTGNWYVHFNSDSTVYGSDFGNIGSSLVLASGVPAQSRITIAPYSVLILSQAPDTTTLSVTLTNGTLNVSWPKAFSSWVLDSSGALPSNPSQWNPVPSAQYQTNSTQIFFTTNSPASYNYYRLRKP